MKTRRLSANVEIPYLGFGTYLIANDQVAAAVSEASRAGYRHIDTAEGYQNEPGVGSGIKQARRSSPRAWAEAISSLPPSSGPGTRRGGSRQRPPSPR